MKLCECGCGMATRLARQTDSRRGVVKGQPHRYVAGHSYCGRYGTASKTRSKFVDSMADVPSGTPLRCKAGEGYIRLGWKVGHRKYIYAYEHRYLMGFPDANVYHVHHKNGDKTDNRIANLEVLTVEAHQKVHHPVSFDVAEAKRLYESGVRTTELARRFGVNSTSISKHIKAAGAVVHSRIDVSMERLMSMHRRGMWPSAIGAELGVGEWVIRCRLREMGLRQNHKPKSCMAVAAEPVEAEAE